MAERNVEFIRKVADAIESSTNTLGKLHFNMSTYHGLDDECGTVACIAGYAAWLADPDGFATRGDAHIVRTAKEAMGITDSLGSHLFVPGGNMFYGDIKPEWAIAELRKLADDPSYTVPIDWPDRYAAGNHGGNDNA